MMYVQAGMDMHVVCIPAGLGIENLKCKSENTHFQTTFLFYIPAKFC